MSSDKRRDNKPMGDTFHRIISESRSDHENNSSKEEKKDLLNELEEKRTDLYRYVEFKVPKNHRPFSIRNYQKRVSFDTINIQYNDDERPWFQDTKSGDYDRTSNDNSRGRGRIRSSSPSESSPGTSPSRFLSPSERQEMSRLLSPYRKCYPTRPIVNNDGCIYTKMHNKFQELYQGELYNEKNNWSKPVLPRRCILIFISGRKHTWVSLDWILRHFIENGDSIVIVTAVDNERLSWKRTMNQYCSNQGVTRTPTSRLMERNRAESIPNISKDIMAYAMEIVNPDKIVRITVEISLGKTKQVLKDMYRLYQPNLVSTGAKLNSRRSAPLRSWNSSRITDRLVKLFPVPVMVVPSITMGKFETELEYEINSRYSINKSADHEALERQHSIKKRLEEISSSSNLPSIEDEGDPSDTESFNSDASISSSSDESYSSFDEISRIYFNYRGDIAENLNTLQKKAYDENYFSNIVKYISDRSSEFCQDLKLVDPNFKGRGAKLAKELTGSNRFGTSPYKTKSMLVPEHPQPVKKRTTAAGTSMSYKDIKRSIGGRSPNLSPSSSPPPTPPTISIDSVNVPPKPSSLKFLDARKPPKKSTQPLKKYLSHDIDASSTRPMLEVSRSQPDITVRDQKSSKERRKHKRKSFWKIFS